MLIQEDLYKTQTLYSIKFPYWLGFLKEITLLKLLS